jgi:hypothetical protein
MARRSQARAVKNALTRLGMQASAHEVVAFLASYGTQVSASLVQQVRRELVKQSAKKPLLPASVRVRRPPKVPPPRHYHR